LKKPEPVFIIFGMQYRNNLASKGMYNFSSNWTLTIHILYHFSRVAEITFSHLTAMFLNVLFNKEDCILIKNLSA